MAPSETRAVLSEVSSLEAVVDRVFGPGVAPYSEMPFPCMTRLPSNSSNDRAPLYLDRRLQTAQTSGARPGGNP